MTEQNPSVLVVDDSPEMLDLLREVLGGDYKVRVAIGGGPALKLARQAPPDIVLLDVMMPEMDGYQVCRLLKQDPQLADIPVIFITSMDEVEDEELGFAVGAVDYITKPISPPLVRARVATHVKLMQQRRQAERSARIKADMLAMMSHEIRTPLHGILGTVRLLMDSRLDTEQTNTLKIVHSSGEALLAILNDALDLAKLEAGKLAIDPVRFELAEAVESVVALMESRAREKAVDLVLDVAPGLPGAVIGDPIRLKQVLLNLVGNAIKFTEAGRVTVSVAASANGMITFSVTDTGIGIDPKALPGLFADFVQQDASIARRFGGTGLGLSICKKLVTLMEGDIQVESTPGVGSTFRVRLPMPMAPAATAPSPETPRADDAPLTILVADDNPVNQRLAKVILTQHNHVVHLASDGEAAVKAVAQGRFDVVLMDVRMPVIDGLEATRRIRALSGPAAQTPVLAVTGMALDEELQTCLAAGMTDVVVKPYSRSTLFDAIRRVTADRSPLSQG
ncbi:response regulator [Magnetospirillum moscoviense]|uniref:histidine kinase n=1 Tax=Magnetospirillum moscoviense TaxID=1437059 RepID=A0A178M7S1_9PROT|nr:response regulator [Magnetospirillum moscoviense]OAN44098.1 hypothetical protein A6A05_17780 [Magnetospirillum moscoviense]